MTALGAAVRIAFHTGRSFGGDEVGTLFFVQKPAAYILTHFEVWLSNNYYILLEKGVKQFVGESDWHLMAATFLAGIATIPAVAALGLKLSGRTTALVAAFLASVNPYLVINSGTIRGYALQVLFGVLALDRLLVWEETRSWRNGWQLGACVLLGGLAHPSIGYLFLLLGALATIDLMRRRFTIREAVRLVVPVAAAGLLLVAAYWRIYPQLSALEAGLAVPAPSLELFPTAVFTEWNGGSRVASALALLLIVFGAFMARARRGTWILVAGIVLPFLAASLMGVAIYPWAVARYFAFSVPLVLILVASGIVASASAIHLVPRPAGMTALSLLLTAFWSWSLLGAWREERRHPYGEAAALIAASAGPSTAVVCDGFDRVSLAAHFRSSLGPAHYRGARSELLSVKEAWRLDPADFYFVTTAPPLRSSESDRRVGDISIRHYRGDANGSAMAHLRRDLQATVAGPTDKSLLAHYEALLTVAEGWDDAVRRQAIAKYLDASRLEGEEELTPTPLLRRETAARERLAGELANGATAASGPLVITRLVPASTEAGIGFQVQQGGDSAISVICQNATRSVSVFLDGRPLATTFGNPGWVTALVPKEILMAPGEHTVHIGAGSLRSNAVEFVVTRKSAVTPRVH
jgi:hypothetical protein